MKRSLGRASTVRMSLPELESTAFATGERCSIAKVYEGDDEDELLSGLKFALTRSTFWEHVPVALSCIAFSSFCDLASMLQSLKGW